MSDTTGRPLVSVVMTCFNQRRYVAESIDSVLSQSYSNLELILIDDGSTDGTPDLVSKYRDPRFKYIWQPNQGPSAATNRGIASSSGDFIALMGGDDISLPDRLLIQIDQMRDGFDILFSTPKLIDDDCRTLPYTCYSSFFRPQALTAHELYHDLYWNFNSLCGPTAFAKRSFFETVGIYKLGYIQLQDFDLWIRACKAGARIRRFEQSLLYYRIRSDGLNLSGPRYLNRVSLEMRGIYREFFSGASAAFLRRAFPRHIGVASLDGSVSLEVDLSLLLLAHHSHLVKAVALERVINSLDRVLYFEELKSRGFELSDLFHFANEVQYNVL